MTTRARKILKGYPFPEGTGHVNAKLFTGSQKDRLGNMFFTKSSNSTVFEDLYGISRKLTQKYARRMKDGGCHHDTMGRRPILDESDKIEYLNFVKNTHLKETVAECQEKLLELAKKRADIAGEYGERVTTISRWTTKRIEEELDIKAGNAELSTEARLEAVASVKKLREFRVHATHDVKNQSV